MSEAVLKWKQLLSWMWLAESGVTDDGIELNWCITEREDGTFYLDGTDMQLNEHRKEFHTLADAKAWCQQREDELVAGSGGGDHSGEMHNTARETCNGFAGKLIGDGFRRSECSVGNEFVKVVRACGSGPSCVVIATQNRFVCDVFDVEVRRADCEISPVTSVKIPFCLKVDAVIWLADAIDSGELLTMIDSIEDGTSTL